jgi:hypothetical protein
MACVDFVVFKDGDEFALPDFAALGNGEIGHAARKFDAHGSLFSSD